MHGAAYPSISDKIYCTNTDLGCCGARVRNRILTVASLVRAQGAEDGARPPMKIWFGTSRKPFVATIACTCTCKLASWTAKACPADRSARGCSRRLPLVRTVRAVSGVPAAAHARGPATGARLHHMRSDATHESDHADADICSRCCRAGACQQTLAIPIGVGPERGPRWSERSPSP